MMTAYRLIDTDLEFTLEDTTVSTAEEISSSSLKVLIRNNLDPVKWVGTSKVTNGLTSEAHIHDAMVALAQLVRDKEVQVSSHPKCSSIKLYRLAPTHKTIFSK